METQFEDASPPPLPDEERTVWYHETDSETPAFIKPSTEQVGLPATIDFTFYNLSESAISGSSSWALWKLVDGQWRAAGESGIPLVVTGTGETMQEARRQAYDRVDDIVIPNLYYRDDIGERWIDGDGDRLLAWGYLGPAGE